MAARAERRGWHPEDIKAELRKRLGNLTTLAVRWGFHRAAVSSAILRPRKRRGVARMIAEALDERPHTLWPDAFPPEGESTPRTVNTRDRSRVAPAPHRQKGNAA